MPGAVAIEVSSKWTSNR